MGHHCGVTVTDDRPAVVRRTLLVSVATASVYVWVTWANWDDVDAGTWAGLTVLASVVMLGLSPYAAPPSRQTLWGLALGLMVGLVACLVIAFAAIAEYGV